jgi:hypothetical protein
MEAVKKTPAPSRARRVLRTIATVVLVLVFAGVVAGGWVYHRARAQVSENLFDLGAQMMRYAQASHQDAPRDLVLNEQLIRFSSGTARASADTVLDFFEARCENADGELGEQVASLREQHPDAIWPAAQSSSPVMREDDGRHGYVACMDLGRTSLGVNELAERLQRFGETGDVHDVGDMRFVFVEEYEREGHTTTHFVTMWTNGSFDVKRMFPDDGDAPGRDVEGLARPPRARRMLSGYERGQPYTLTVYQTREDEAELESFYRDALADGGFSLLEMPERQARDVPRTLIAEQGERMVTIVLATNPETGSATAAVLDGR